MSPFPLGAGSIFWEGGGGGGVKKRQSPNFRSPEVGISVKVKTCLHQVNSKNNVLQNVLFFKTLFTGINVV